MRIAVIYIAVFSAALYWVGCDTAFNDDNSAELFSPPFHDGSPTAVDLEVPDNSDDDDDTEPGIIPDYDTDFEGFGANATGGEGGESAVVTSLEDAGGGTLREAVENADGPLTVTFDVDGIIDLASVVDLPSDITIDARGRDITLTTNGFRIDDSHNIIIMNIAFKDVSGDTGDGVQIMNGSSDIVIFHCSFDNEGLMPFKEDIPDETISVVWGATDVTISWCRFANHDKVMLIGNGDAPAEIDRNIRVTFHHNLFENTGRRHPFMRYGQVDMYNNIIRNWRPYLAHTYGTRAQSNGEILSEANYYYQPKPLRFIGSYFRLGGKIRHVNTVAVQPWIMLLENKPAQVFARPYNATIHSLTGDYFEVMENHTGNTMPLQ